MLSCGWPSQAQGHRGPHEMQSQPNKYVLIPVQRCDLMKTRLNPPPSCFIVGKKNFRKHVMKRERKREYNLFWHGFRFIFTVSPGDTHARAHVCADRAPFLCCKTFYSDLGHCCHGNLLYELDQGVAGVHHLQKSLRRQVLFISTGTEGLSLSLCVCVCVWWWEITGMAFLNAKESLVRRRAVGQRANTPWEWHKHAHVRVPGPTVHPTLRCQWVFITHLPRLPMRLLWSETWPFPDRFVSLF